MRLVGPDPPPRDQYATTRTKESEETSGGRSHTGYGMPPGRKQSSMLASRSFVVRDSVPIKRSLSVVGIQRTYCGSRS